MQFLISVVFLYYLTNSKAFACVTCEVPTSDSVFYVFAQFWNGESCRQNPNYPGCLVPLSPSWNKVQTIHGLWPNYKTSGYPQFCTDESYDPTMPYQLGYVTMTTNWPSVIDAVDDYASFWEHEFTKHGTCTHLTQLQYFQETLKLYSRFPTPDIITSNYGNTVSATSLRNAFGGPEYVALQCDGGMYYSAVYTCWDKDANDRPTVQMKCNADVISEDTCTSSSIVIPSFDGTIAIPSNNEISYKNQNVNVSTIMQETVYVFKQYWEAENCYASSAPGCLNPIDLWKTNLTINTLATQFTSSGYPTECTNEAFNISVIDEVGRSIMESDWPNLDYTTNDGNYANVWSSAWSKFGVCTGLSQYDYFSSTLQLFTKVGTPSAITSNIGKSYIPRSTIENGFGGSNFVALTCKNTYYITGAYTCYNHDSNGLITTQAECPAAVLGMDSCATGVSATLNIVSF